MAERLTRNYGLKGDPESRLELEFDNVYKTKLDATLDKKAGLENATTAPQGELKLRSVSGVWGLYIRIESDWYMVALTKV